MSDFPRTQVEDVSLPRLLIGTNWFLGYSHTSKAKDKFIEEEIGSGKVADILEVFLAAGVDAIRVNYAEMVQLAGRPLQDDKRIESAARGLIESGKCHQVVVSLGAGRAIVVTPERARRIVSPAVPIRSRVGAGDSMLAGIVLRLAQGSSFEDAVRFGVAAGTAAVMTEGSELCRREDAERLFAFMNEARAQ